MRAIFHDEPSTCIFLCDSSEVGHHPYKDSYVGDEALDRNPTFPLTNGEYEPFKDVEKIWEQAFYNELRIDPTNISLLHSNWSINNSKTAKIAEMAFESFKIGQEQRTSCLNKNSNDRHVTHVRQIKRHLLNLEQDHFCRYHLQFWQSFPME